MALKRAAFTPRDYFLPVSFSRHAAQPPSPVSRRDAGSCLPTRRIASITSSAGILNPTPEIAGFAAHGTEGRNLHAPRLPSPRLIQPARRAAAFAGLAKGRGKLPPHAAHRVDHLVRGHDQSHARKSAAFTRSDYFLPVSFSRHAAQPPSPISRRDAGSCLPTRRIASITSSAGMIGPTPESAGFAAHGVEARSIHARRLLSIQPPSPVSRRDAGSYLPTRRIASITSSAGMIGPTPEIAGFAVHGAEARSIHAPRLLSPRLVQTTRRAAAFAGFAQGRGKLPPHAAHRVDLLVRGHDRPHARERGVRGAWR